MRQETKVILLLLCLIALIVTCVYTHVDKIKLQLEESNKTLEKLDETKIKEESISIKLPIKEEAKEETQSNIEVISEEKALENKELETVVNTEEKVQELKEEVEEKIEEVIPQEPLIKTKPGYIRRVGEDPIEKLSRASQELQIEINKYMRENPIVFLRASDRITKASNKTVDKIAQILKENPTIIFEVAGHTDAAGAKKTNKTISTLRAISVKKKLIARGIDKKRLKARGYGEDIPLVKNSAKGYSRVNRRVEFNIIEE